MPFLWNPVNVRAFTSPVCMCGAHQATQSQVACEDARNLSKAMWVKAALRYQKLSSQMRRWSPKSWWIGYRGKGENTGVSSRCLLSSLRNQRGKCLLRHLVCALLQQLASIPMKSVCVPLCQHEWWPCASPISVKLALYLSFTHLLTALAGVAVSFSNSSFSENITTLSVEQQLEKFKLAISFQTNALCQELVLLATLLTK